MKRFQRFSIRSLLIVTMVLCGLLTVWMNGVQPYREQRAAIEMVSRLNGRAEMRPQEGSDWQRWLVDLVIEEGAFVAVTEVNLHGAQFGEGDAARLAGLIWLEHLSLDRSSITDADLAALASMRGLQTLGLRYCGISDEGLSRLGEKPFLAELSLTGCEVSDSSVDRLLASPSLRLLLVRWTRLSQAGVDRLAARLPGCQIAYQPRSAEES